MGFPAGGSTESLGPCRGGGGAKPRGYLVRFIAVDIGKKLRAIEPTCVPPMTSL